MNKILTAVVSLLIIANIAMGALQFQLSARLSDARSQLSGQNAAQTDLTALQTNIAKDKATLSALGINLSQLAPSQSSVSVDYSSLIAKVTPAVVRLDMVGPRLYGSGVIISAKGYILTSEHVIRSATSISVTLSTGDKFIATIAASDIANDIAILKMNSSRTDFPSALLGSSAKVATGDRVIAAGFPLGSELPGPVSVTAGIVSALRLDPADGVTYIQNTASLTFGSGGGGLFGLDGKLIGIPSTGPADGIYMATPVDLTATIIASTVK